MKKPERLILYSAYVSVFLSLFFWVLAKENQSQSGLAQASDSVMDASVGFLLYFSVLYHRSAAFDVEKFAQASSLAAPDAPDSTREQARAQRRLRRAEQLEAIAACIVGALSLLIASGLLTQVYSSYQEGRFAIFRVGLLGVFLTKAAFKALIVWLLRGAERPSLRALSVDAKNDVILGGTAALSYATLLLGQPLIEMLAALLAALWIFKNGWELLRENGRGALLLGEEE